MLALPLHLLQRHPLTVTAHFHHSLVLTFALPERPLDALLPPGLHLDTHRHLGFVAIALVQTTCLRPALLPPALGQNFFLAGYRIFATFKPKNANTLRGLYILRSDTDRRLMALAGNLLTHYQYRVSKVAITHLHHNFACRIDTPRHLADLDLTADLAAPGQLPSTSPFDNFHEARRFAGPLPYTFDHEPQTNSIIAIKATRKNWNPALVNVDIRRLTFFNHPPFTNATPRLASAFHVENIDYQWNPGTRHRL